VPSKYEHLLRKIHLIIFDTSVEGSTEVCCSIFEKVSPLGCAADPKRKSTFLVGKVVVWRDGAGVRAPQKQSLQRTAYTKPVL